MKKIVGILLCIVFICFAFVGCEEKKIGADLENRPDNSNNNKIMETLNMYVIVEDGTAEKATQTVPSNINAYLKEAYEVQLNIKYCTEAEYYDTVMASLEANVTDGNRADIVLINSKAMFDTLYNDYKLAELTSFYNKNFQKLNAIVEDKLLASSVIVEATGDKTSEQTYYTVPNNHLIGEYKYIVIDKATARDLFYSSDKINAMNDERDLALYQASIGEDKVSCVSGSYELKLLLEYGFKSYQEFEDYFGEDKPEIIEKSGELFFNCDLKKVNFVNIAAYPNATAYEAFSSAYAVVKSLGDIRPNCILKCSDPYCAGTVTFTKALYNELKSKETDTEKMKVLCPLCSKQIKHALTEEEQVAIDNHYTKCMEVIFALNNDPELLNMLQYGYVGTNYIFDNTDPSKNTVKYKEPAADVENTISYFMNLKNVGNAYIAYYCNQIGWNATVHNNTLKQNAASYTLAEKLTEELKTLTDMVENDGILNLSFCQTYTLKDNGTKHGDVIINWTCASEYVTINSDTNQIYVSYTDSADPLKITLTAELVCEDLHGERESVSKNFEVVIDYTSEQKLDREYNIVTLDGVLCIFDNDFVLPSQGLIHKDVAINWSTANTAENIQLEGNKLLVTGSSAGATFELVLVATYSTTEDDSEESIEITKEFIITVYSREDMLASALERVELALDELTFESTITLPMNDSEFEDINFVWSVENENVTIEDGVLSFIAPDDEQAFNFDLKLSLELTYGENSSTLEKEYVGINVEAPTPDVAE